MKPEAQIKALAELDGWTSLGHDAEMTEHWIQFPREVISKLSYEEIRRQRVWRLPDYNTYDAIIPLIQKQSKLVQDSVSMLIGSKHDHSAWIRATPAQLREALLMATGKWTE